MTAVGRFLALLFTAWFAFAAGQASGAGDAVSADILLAGTALALVAQAFTIPADRAVEREQRRHIASLKEALGQARREARIEREAHGSALLAASHFEQERDEARRGFANALNEIDRLTRRLGQEASDAG